MITHVSGQPPGPRRLTAFALAALDTAVVRRSTIRALLPKGETKHRGPAARERWHVGDKQGLYKNKTSIAFGHALQEFERQGWVDRSPDIVVIHDRQALYAFAHSAEPAVTPSALNTRAALTAARGDLRRARPTASHSEIQQRHDEIRALLYLLHAAEPDNHGRINLFSQHVRWT